MARVDPLAERVRRAQVMSGRHGSSDGMRFSYSVWNTYRRPTKKVQALVDRLQKQLDESCTPAEAALLNIWGCRPTFYAPHGRNRKDPSDEEWERARHLCHARALKECGFPAKVYSDWQFGMNSDIGWSVVVVPASREKTNG